MKNKFTHLMLKYILNEYNLNQINQLVIKSIHTNNIQSDEYNYNKIYSKSYKFNWLLTILIQCHLMNMVIHMNTFT